MVAAMVGSGGASAVTAAMPPHAIVSGRALLKVLLAALLGSAAPVAATGDAAEAFDCSRSTEATDEEALRAARCCEAKRLWREIEANGGCGGTGDSAASPRDCRAAAALCRECYGPLAGSNASASASEGAWLTNGTNGSREGVELASLDPSALAMRCVLPEASEDCALQGEGIAMAFCGGIVLLVVAVALAAAFDRIFLPRMVATFMLRWTTPAKYQPAGGPSPKATPIPPELPAAAAAPPGEPPPWAACLGSAEDGAVVVGAPLTPPPVGSDVLRSAAAGPLDAPPCMPSTAAAAPAPSSALALQPQRRPLPPPLDLGEPALPRAPTEAAALAVQPLGNSSPLSTEGAAVRRHGEELREATRVRLPQGPGPMPARLAAVWAFRAAFLAVAGLAGLARTAHSLLAAAFVLHRTALLVAAELVSTLLPLAWVAWGSRPPADIVAGLPEHIAYSCPCQRVPRFTAFAVLTVIVEIYCTMTAAWSTGEVTCHEAPWRTVMLYCLGIPAAVSRSYSAYLALQVQEKFHQAQRRIVPIWSTGAVQEPPKKKKRRDGPLNFVDLQCIAADSDFTTGECRQRSPHRNLAAAASNADADDEEGTRPEVWAGWQAALGRPSPKGSQPTVASKMLRKFAKMCRLRLPAAQDDVRDISASPGASSPRPPPLGGRGRLGTSMSLASLAGVSGWRRRSKFRVLVITGLICVVFIATISVWAIHIASKADSEELPSACVTAQNATATCAHFEAVGQHLWDARIGDLVAGTRDTLEDCCRGCDLLNGCQAWMFEAFGRRCRWIRFTEAPCSENPGDLRCRCLTHFGMSFGFKPTSEIIWVKRE